MQRVQLAAAALMIVGAAVGAFTVWQAVSPPPAGLNLEGPAPVLVGDAPIPATSTPDSGTPVPSDPETLVARNLAPATSDLPAAATPTANPDGGAVNSASRTQKSRDAEPVSLRIPRLGIDPVVVPVGLNAFGEMASPTDYSEVGWWQYGAAPGDFGRAVIAGHVDSLTDRAVFHDLEQLEPGDEIYVTRSGSSTEELRFLVSGAALYHVDHAPIDQIFGPSVEQELVLITCGGTFDRGAGVYLYRRVIFAKLADGPERESGPRSSES